MVELHSVFRSYHRAVAVQVNDVLGHEIVPVSRENTALATDLAGESHPPVTIWATMVDPALGDVLFE